MKPLWQRLNEERTQGEWKINHWSKGKSGVSCVTIKDGIKYFTGDAISDSFYGVRSKPKEYNISGSFEGAHICDIPHFNGLDGGIESKANAQYTALAVNNLASLAEALSVIKEMTNNAAIRMVINKALNKIS